MTEPPHFSEEEIEPERFCLVQADQWDSEWDLEHSYYGSQSSGIDWKWVTQITRWIFISHQKKNDQQHGFQQHLGWKYLLGR